jgi:two-component system copper resistance phosphate regulon response regulator CusR
VILVTKIDIISGFLGAGKTTLINRLIHEAYKGEKIVLTQKEFALLKLLFENRGEGVSRERALTEVFSDTDTKTNVVDVYVNYLRAKIDHKFDVRMILTVRGCGYMIGK